jgi:hypothetical protein
MFLMTDAVFPAATPRFFYSSVVAVADRHVIHSFFPIPAFVLRRALFLVSFPHETRHSAVPSIPRLWKATP